MIIEENLLHDKDGHGLAQFRPSLHDTQAQGDDLSREEEVDHVRRVVLHQGANDSQGRQAEILEGTRLRGRVQEWVEEERNVGYTRLARTDRAHARGLTV